MQLAQPPNIPKEIRINRLDYVSKQKDGTCYAHAASTAIVETLAKQNGIHSKDNMIKIHKNYVQYIYNKYMGK